MLSEYDSTDFCFEFPENALASSHGPAPNTSCIVSGHFQLYHIFSPLSGSCVRCIHAHSVQRQWTTSVTKYTEYSMESMVYCNRRNSR